MTAPFSPDKECYTLNLKSFVIDGDNAILPKFMFKSINWELISVFLICLLAFLVRLPTIRFPYLIGVTPHIYGLSWTKQVLAGIPPQNTYALLPYTLAGLYSLLRVFGFSLMDVIKISPPIMGALTIIPFYLILKTLYDKNVAKLGALFMAVSLANAFKTVAGLTDKNVIWVPINLFALYLFIKGNNKVIYSVFAGLLLGLTTYAHELYVWSFFLVGLFALLRVARHNRNINHILSLAMASGLGLSISILWGDRSSFPYSYVFPITVVLVLGVLCFSIVYHILLNDLRKRCKVILVVVVGLLAALFVFFYGQTLLAATNGFTSFLLLPMERRVFADNQPSKLSDYFNYLGALVFLIPLGLYRLIQRRKTPDLFTLVWFSLAFAFTQNMMIFMFILAPPACAVASVAAAFILSELTSLKMDSKWGKWKLRGVRFLALFVILLTVSTNLVNTVTTVWSYEPVMNDARNQAMLWLKEETPKDATVFCSYWDGSTFFIPAIAERKTIHGSFDRIVTSTNETEIRDFLGQHMISYIYVDQHLQLVFYLTAHLLDIDPKEYAFIEKNSLLFRMLYPESLGLPDYILKAFDNQQVRIYEVILDYPTMVNTFSYPTKT